MKAGKNRLGIYHIYDKAGVIDEYILYLLNRITGHLKELYIVCNGEVNQDDLNRLKTITRNVMIRENIGFDAGGFKYALTEKIGWEKIKEYDELLLFNDSFFGPIDTFDEVFKRMDQKDVDFWTLTGSKGNAHSEAVIQSYFINIKKRLLKSKDFRQYWEDIPYFDSFTDVVRKYEMSFARYFESRGYTWEAFIHNEDYFFKEEGYGISPYHDLQYEIMAFQNYPVIKRKLLSLSANSHSYGIDRQGKEQTVQALKYIKDKKEYNTDLIWENILRCYSLREIQESCCLRQVLSGIGGEEYKEDKAAAFLILKDRKMNHENLKRLKNKNIHIVLISDSLNMLQEVDQKSFLSKEMHLAESALEAVKIIDNRLPEMEKKYKYCCFISDFYWEKGEIPYTVGASKLWEDWENIIGRDSYLNHVIKILEENQKCGLLVSPRPFHAHYFGERGESVRLEDIRCKRFVEKNGLEEYLSRSKRKAWWSNSFWTRTALLKEIFDGAKAYKEDGEFSWKYLDSFCEILPYWYQKKGYYTEVVCSDIFARNRFTLEESCMETMIAQFREIGEFHTYIELLQLLKIYYKNVNKIQEFRSSHNKIYIYGAGYKARVISHLHCLNGFECFLVSDGREKCNVLDNHPVKYLSQVQLEADDGIVLGLNKDNTYQVTEALKDMNVTNDTLQIDDGGMFDGVGVDFSI
ncbi:rhamnan synthesis F family protein [Lachnospiraceae bacterium 62-35]